jgi:Protein of unknown function (DUF3024)
MSSPVPDFDVARIRRYAEDRVPERARHQVRNDVVVSGTTVTIVERRAPWRPDGTRQWTSFPIVERRAPWRPDGTRQWTSFPIAQLRWNPGAATWTLYWRDRDIRWHRFPGTPSAGDVGVLLAEIPWRAPSGADLAPTTFAGPWAPASGPDSWRRR